MPLTFNLRHLERKPLHLTGELPSQELDAEGVDELIELQDPVGYDLHIERMGHDLLVQGSLQFTLNCECARCLKRFRKAIRLEPWSVDLPLTGEEEVAVDNDTVDLTPYVREDILLAFPQHPLCKADCPGLAELRDPTQNPSGQPGSTGSASTPWAALDKLEF